jgi:hypothetical protein
MDAAGKRLSLVELMAALPARIELQEEGGPNAGWKAGPSVANSDHSCEISLRATIMSTQRIHFIPLESDPYIFTDLIRALGVRTLEFQDVLSLDLPDLISTGSLALPAPIYALILIFPTTRAHEAELYEAKRLARSAGTQYTGRGPKEPVIWFEQTIHNACGLYAILHAVSNVGRTFIGMLGRPAGSLSTRPGSLQTLDPSSTRFSIRVYR